MVAEEGDKGRVIWMPPTLGRITVERRCVCLSWAGKKAASWLLCGVRDEDAEPLEQQVEERTDVTILHRQRYDGLEDRIFVCESETRRQ